LKGADLAVSHNAPRSQHPSKDVSSSHLNCTNAMSVCVK